MHENREAENILGVSTDFALNLPARKMCLGIKLVSSDTPRSLRCIRIRSLSFIETHIVLPVTRTLAMDHKNDERRKGGRDEEGRTWTIVMTLSSPALNAPLGKMNLSSVSSRMLLLFVELQTVVKNSCQRQDHHQTMANQHSLSKARAQEHVIQPDASCEC
jgi:hypothetical protein